MPRLFVAIDLPERIVDDLMDTYEAIPGARWVSEEQLHLTLRFIGEVQGDAAERIAGALRTVTVPPFSLSLKGVGYFPPRREPRILWAGLSSSGELMRLQRRVERAVTGAGIEPDARSFHPHITVARLQGAHREKVARYITGHTLFATEPFEVSEFHLYSSVLRKEGAHHEIEETFPLNPDSPATT